MFPFFSRPPTIRTRRFGPSFFLFSRGVRRVTYAATTRKSADPSPTPSPVTNQMSTSLSFFSDAKHRYFESVWCFLSLATHLRSYARESTLRLQSAFPPFSLAIAPEMPIFTMGSPTESHSAAPPSFGHSTIGSPSPISRRLCRQPDRKFLPFCQCRAILARLVSMSSFSPTAFLAGRLLKCERALTAIFFFGVMASTEAGHTSFPLSKNTIM